MAIDVTILFHKLYGVIEQNGVAKASPALERSARLYAIYNNTTANHVYVGTATNLQDRFDGRIAALREFGYDAATFLLIQIRAFQVRINGVNKPPDAYGRSGVIDVEHLLIRLHINRGIATRNFYKVGAYVNTCGQEIRLTLTAVTGMTVPAYLGGAPITATIGRKATY